MMIASDLARFVAVGALAAVDASGHLNFTWIIVLSVLDGPRATGFFYPAFGGMVPLVVEPGAIPSANSLIGVARWGSLLVGPASPRCSTGAAGSAVVFAIDAASFLVSAGLLWFTRPRAVEAAAGEGTVREIWSGVRYVAGVPWLWVTIALFSVVLMLQFAPQQVLLPKLIHQHFGQGVGAYGLLTSLLGVGTVAGRLLRTAPAAPPPRRHLVRRVADQQPGDRRCRVIAMVRAGRASSRCCVGSASASAVAIWETMLMELVPTNLLSRVVSLDFFGSFGLMPVGLAVAAAISGLAAPGTIIAAGALISAAMFAVVLTRPWLRAVD